MGKSLPEHAEDAMKHLAGLGIITAGTPMERLPAGTINTVIRAWQPRGNTVYVRIGPPAGESDAAPSWLRGDALVNEVLVLERVRRVITCVPVASAVGFRSAGRHWVVQEAVPGEPLDIVLPRTAPDERAAIWRQLGALVRQLHGIDAPWFGTPDGSQRFDSWAAMVRADVAGFLDDAHRFGLGHEPYERLLEEVERHEGALRDVDRPMVVHSDLDLRHVFVDRQGDELTITGIIDWEYARYADPFSESLLVDLLSRPETDPDRAAFLAGYGFNAALLSDSAFLVRQAIYHGIVAGWIATDAARLSTTSLQAQTTR